MRLAPLARMPLMIIVLAPSLVHAEKPKTTFKQEIDFLSVSREHVAWPTPESLIAQLRSEDDSARLKALHLFGLPDEQAARLNAVASGQIRLTYAALGTEPTQQAIIAIQDDKEEIRYAAVAVPTPKGWERIAVANCWCKYMSQLDDFVQLRPAPKRGAGNYELILRECGGGSGVYSEGEAHFRVRDGELRNVLSFVSRQENSNAGFSGACKKPNASVECERIERRSLLGNVLVEGRGEFEPTGNDLDYSAGLLQDRHLQVLTCRTYDWNERTFRYTSSGTAKSCDTVANRARK